MHFFYDLAVLLSWYVLQLVALFNPKIRQFVSGRKEVVSYLENNRDPGRKLIWMHTASLGEFEQGLPVLERLHKAYPEYQFLVTFFSPSGYEVKKHSLSPHLVCYLPMDTRWNAREFLRLIRPEMGLFVKYEVWPGFFREIQKAGIPILMISAIFRSRQVYFKWYGGFLRKALKRVSHFFVQDEQSLALLQSLDIREVTVSGDTRFDRVFEIRDGGVDLPFMEGFKGGRTCLVGGSTWPEDHEVLIPYINQAGEGECFVIAPHKTDPKTIESLRNALTVPAAAYSERDQVNLSEERVLIVDTIGLLTRIYAYADLAYVGGGFATGLHNTLEPAVYGIPVLIGPGYTGFREAEELVASGGLRVVQDPEDFGQQAGSLMASEKQRQEMGQINRAYLQGNRGASEQILKGIASYLS